MSKLTVGMAVYDDFDGVYFTVQALRMYHPSVSIVVVDNNPDSAHGKATKNFVKSWAKATYLPFRKRVGTAIRDAVFQVAQTEWVMCIDSHVLLCPGAIECLLNYIGANPESQDLLHGPLIYDGLDGNQASHMRPVWGPDKMLGRWGRDPRADSPDGEPFEIPMHGMGLFACRKQAWLGFNPRFRGFGGEEGYIHEKYRQAGHKILCLPGLRWVHRFGRPSGVPYKLAMEDRVHNYLTGWIELGKDTKEILEVFKDTPPGEAHWQRVLDEIYIAHTTWQTMKDDKPNVILLGVGHSGTSIVTKIMHKLGWERGDADKFYAESVSVRKLNAQAIKEGKLDQEKAMQALAHPGPWIFKDPRTVLTLQHWLPLIEKMHVKPTLLWLSRDIEYVRRSYIDRGYVNRKGEPALYSKTLDALYSLAENGYNTWPWAKVRLTFEDVMEAAKLFNLDIATRRKP